MKNYQLGNTLFVKRTPKIIREIAAPGHMNSVKRVSFQTISNRTETLSVGKAKYWNWNKFFKRIFTLWFRGSPGQRDKIVSTFLAVNFAIFKNVVLEKSKLYITSRSQTDFRQLYGQAAKSTQTNQSGWKRNRKRHGKKLSWERRQKSVSE